MKEISTRAYHQSRNPQVKIRTNKAQITEILKFSPETVETCLFCSLTDILRAATYIH